MYFHQGNIKKAALVLSGIVIIGGGIAGTIFLILQLQNRNEKSFGDLSVPAPGTVSETDQSGPSSPTPKIPFDESKLPDFLKHSPQEVRNKNVQLVPDPTKEEIRAYITEVERLAVSATSVRIDGCEPDPVIVRAISSASLSFVNNDEVARLISVEDKKFAIEARGKQDIPMSFSSGTGIYNYDCDGHFSVGTFLIE